MCYNIKKCYGGAGVQGFLEEQLHQRVDIIPYNEDMPIPLYLKNSYELSVMKILETKCLLMRPLDKINFAALKKHYAKLQSLTNLQCVLYFKEVNVYACHKMIECGIPFIQEGRQIYLPFLGMILSKNLPQRKSLEAKQKVSFMTQQFLLLAIYHQWKKMTVTQVAQQMQVSKMSVSRCFDELEALDLHCIQRRGRNRFFVWQESWQTLWQSARIFLQNPIVKQYNLQEQLNAKKLLLAGIAAISMYSMLDNNSYAVYAVDKTMAATLKLKDKLCVPAGEAPAEVIAVMQYVISFHDGQTIDPLSAILMLSEEDKEDPRVEMAVDEMLKEQLWSKD
jgi:hypothetical protein